MFYVYKHITLNTNELFYIGKGSKSRYCRTTGRNTYWNNIVFKYGFKAEIIKKFSNELEAYKYEEFLINKYKNKGLCRANLAKGGRGGSAGISRPISMETRAKISKALKGRKPSLETIKKLKKARQGRSPSKGIIRTNEANRKTALSMTRNEYITHKGTFLLAKDAAEIYNVSQSTIVRWCNKNNKYHKPGFNRVKTIDRR